MKFKKVKGMEDYYPKEEAVKNAVFSKLREQANKYGFKEVSSPAMETTDLLTAKSGEEIKGQLFNLEKKGKEQLSLRFDLTVPITRMFVTKQRAIPKPVKWFAIDRMWRYEAPQQGRNREFYQLSVELFGSDKPEADAECINLALNCLKSFGLTSKDIVLKINNRKLLEGILIKLVPEKKMEDAVRMIDKSSKIPETEFAAELEALGITKPNIKTLKELIACKGKPKILDDIQKRFSLNSETLKGLLELKKTLELVDDKWVEVDLSIARGLAYYTGNVYECFDKGGQYRALFGGGRYDELVKLFGGQKCPATGFGLGLATLMLLLEDKKLIPRPETGPEYYIAPVGETLLKAKELADKLRKKTTVDIDLMRRSLSKQFDYADSIGAKKVIVIGEADLKKGKVTVKDMKTGTDKKVSLDKLVKI